MTQIDRPAFYRSDAHDDAVLTGPIDGLPIVRGATPPAGVPRRHVTPHPSSPLPVQSPPPPRGSKRIAIVVSTVAVVGAVLFLVLGTGLFAGAVADVALPTTVHQVTYEVATAKGTRIAATYSRSRSDGLASASISGVRSPWRADAEVSGVMGPMLTASLSPEPGRVGRSRPSPAPSSRTASRSPGTPPTARTPW